MVDDSWIRARRTRETGDRWERGGLDGGRRGIVVARKIIEPGFPPLIGARGAGGGGQVGLTGNRWPGDTTGRDSRIATPPQIRKSLIEALAIRLSGRVVESLATLDGWHERDTQTQYKPLPSQKVVCCRNRRCANQVTDK